MDALLDQCFDNIESTLTVLVESIASYSPSQQAVVDLIAADSELGRALEQLAVHQANYQRILSLRQTVETLDGQIKSSLRVLADTRRELIAAPITGPVPNSRDVSMPELLAYARHIGRFTVPPNFRPPPRKENVPEATLQHPRAEEVAMANDDSRPAGAVAATEESRTMATLNAEQKTWLTGLSALPWFPWPTEDRIRQGALGQIQAMVEQGRDPAVVLSSEELEQRARRAAAEEDERRQEEEARRDEAEQKRRISHAPLSQPGDRGEQPAVFGGLDLY